MFIPGMVLSLRGLICPPVPKQRKKLVQFSVPITNKYLKYCFKNSMTSSWHRGSLNFTFNIEPT